MATLEEDGSTKGLMMFDNFEVYSVDVWNKVCCVAMISGCLRRCLGVGLPLVFVTLPFFLAHP